MHSEKHGKTTFHFNSDMSGKAVIVNDNGGFEVEAKDLISFVSERAKCDLLRRLEGELDENDLIWATIFFKEVLPKLGGN